MTSYISLHPGDVAPLRVLCGHDGTETFGRDAGYGGHPVSYLTSELSSDLLLGSLCDDPDTTVDENDQSSGQNDSAPPSPGACTTMEDVKAHNARNDCWIIFYDKACVYLLTSL